MSFYCHRKELMILLLLIFLTGFACVETVFGDDSEPVISDPIKTAFAAMEIKSAPQAGVPQAPTGLAVVDCDGAACGAERMVWVDGEKGDNAHTGLSADEAVETLTRAAEIVRGGDMVIVKPGTYYENPVFSGIGSSADLPVWIRSQTPGQATISGLWKAADQGEQAWQSEGNGIYSADHGDIYSGSYNDAYLFRYKSRSDLEAVSVEGIKKPPYGIAYQQGKVYIRLPHNADPNGKSIQITDQFAQVLIAVNNSPYVILDGFNIEGSGDRYAIDIDGDSHHVTLRNLKVTHCRQAARMPDHGIVEWSEYCYPNFRAFVDDLMNLNGGSTNDAIFPLVKEYYSKNGNAYLEGGLAVSPARASNHNEFRYNYIHDVFDGERLGEFNHSRTHHNVYNYNYDDHIQFESWRVGHPTEDIHAHDNLFLNSASTLLSHQDTSGGMQGPHYVYRNVLHIDDPKHGQAWTVIKSLRVKNKNIYYYHNLVNMGRTRLYWETPENLTFFNNIFLFDDLRGTDGRPDTGHNLLVNNSDISVITGNGGEYLGSNKSAAGIKSLDNMDFTLHADSPAVEFGRRLDGLPDSHTVNGAPDAGPFELGETQGANWPRPQYTTYTNTKPERWRY